MSQQTPNIVRARGVYRANSALYFPPGSQFSFTYVFPDQEVTVRAGTYTVKGPHGPISNGIWTSGEAQGDNLQDTELTFRNLVDDAVGMFSFLTNAATEEPTLEILYNLDVESTTHEAIFSSFTAHYSTPPTVLREPPKFMGKGIKSLGDHEFKERLWRGISSYVTALRNWRIGHEVVAFSFLYMAMEALTRVAREPLFDKFGGAKGLADEWKIDIKKVDPEVRRRILFKGDDELYKSAKTASDSMEHGFGELQDIVDVAERQVVKLAYLVREFIVFQLFGEGARSALLLSDAYNRPLTCVPARASLIGTLSGNREGIAHPNQHPDMSFKLEPTHMAKEQGADWRIQWDTTVPVPALAPGVMFQKGEVHLKEVNISGPHIEDVTQP
ncbi:hypothetical protein [Rathayibacter sp. Leaf248]|uniref:hypothetical protein n=1 Tax=Rathayibacter sp. Leaf248 TaxID=2876555 RepID=UPI001E3C73A4|nr:hypothetical protein [Rathayibacter sp. Leaf248]